VGVLTGYSVLQFFMDMAACHCSQSIPDDSAPCRPWSWNLLAAVPEGEVPAEPRSTAWQEPRSPSVDADRELVSVQDSYEFCCEKHPDLQVHLVSDWLLYASAAENLLHDSITWATSARQSGCMDLRADPYCVRRQLRGLIVVWSLPVSLSEHSAGGRHHSQLLQWPSCVPVWRR